MKYKKLSLASFAACLASTAFAPAFAADMIYPEPEPEPMVVQEPMMVEPQPTAVGGSWYIRGDVGYYMPSLRGTNYVTYGTPGGTSKFDSTKLSNSWSLGAGIGYNVSKHLRVDLTGDFLAKSKFTGSTVGFENGMTVTSTDAASMSAMLLLANAYVDIGTYHGFTPYVGAGIGGANVNWGDLSNTIDGNTTIHKGESTTRFAFALMAGASYCLTNDLELDVGYRYAHVQGGKMFAYAPQAGPIYDHGINMHQAKAGVRWSFGGTTNHRCAPPAPVAEPYFPPIDPPVYK